MIAVGMSDDEVQGFRDASPTQDARDTPGRPGGWSCVYQGGIAARNPQEQRVSLADVHRFET